jgi:tetratricopeptide (TPR) repeat protein
VFVGEKIMYRIMLLVFLIFTFISCSLIGERTSSAEYTIFTSVEGAKVFRADGKDVGETPLVLNWKDIEDVVDGRFVSFLIEKPGYFTRVVFFDASNSINLKIDLDIDKDYKEKRKSELRTEVKFLIDKNKYLLDQKKYFIETIDNYKKQQVNYDENMELLRSRLSVSSFQKTELKATVPIIAVPNLSSIKYTNLVAVRQIEGHKSELNLLSTQLNQCRVSKSIINKKVKKNIKPNRCPAARVKYYPAPRTNKIIRELLKAQFLIINNEFKEARLLILNLEEDNPKVAALYTLLAYIENNDGNLVKARRYLKRSLSIDKNDKMAKRMMKMISLPYRTPAKK